MFEAKVSRDFSVFLIFTQKIIHPFPAHIFPDLRMPGYIQKASFFEHRLRHNFFSGEGLNYRNKLYGQQLLPCDRVCYLSKKLKEDILVAFDWENVGWKMVYNFLGIDEKT